MDEVSLGWLTTTVIALCSQGEGWSYSARGQFGSCQEATEPGACDTNS